MLLGQVQGADIRAEVGIELGVHALFPTVSLDWEGVIAIFEMPAQYFA